MSTTEQPPAVTSIQYSIETSGLWLVWTPATGNPTTIFVPNRMIKNLARVLADETVAKHLQYEAVQYVGRLIRWRRSRWYREVTKQV